MAKIETADPLLVDYHYDATGTHKAMYDAINAATWLPDIDKANIGRESFNRIFAAAPPMRITPGGSTFNTLNAVRRTFAQSAHSIKQYAAIGTDQAGRFLQRYCDENGYTTHPPLSDATRSLIQTPSSLVFNLEGGKRKIATFRGNVRDHILGDTIDNQSPDIIYLNGNGLSNYSSAFYALREKAERLNTPTFFSLPTSRQTATENYDTVRTIMARSHVILANEKELEFIFPGGDLQDRLHELQYFLNTPKKPHFPGAASALLSNGSEGAFVVTPDRIEAIEVWDKNIRTVSAVGCGDNSYAGFLCGLLAGLNPSKSGHMGMAFASDCMQRFEAQLPNPHDVFIKALEDPRIGVTLGAVPCIGHNAAARSVDTAHLPLLHIQMLDRQDVWVQVFVEVCAADQPAFVQALAESDRTPVNIAQFGVVVASCYGRFPDNDIRDSICARYGCKL